jgi:1-aminocyclopropane-1-carboxylate deaminase/D-cysteine desulfhydrase-like pyridoxal-dependent ACC family enzyme
MQLTQNTPIEEYFVKDHKIFVKREDLACIGNEGPHFAKVRGLYKVLKKYKKLGINTVGYMETTVSRAGHGISYFCKKLGMKAVIFKPVYKDGKPRNEQVKQEEQWKKFGAEIIPIQATRLTINFYQAKKILLKKYPNAVMLPQGLPFEETVEEVSKQVIKDKKIMKKVKTVVSCIGSGTMAAGIIRGCATLKIYPKYYGIIVAQKNLKKTKKKIYNIAKLEQDGFFISSFVNVELIDAGYVYTKKEMCDCPFPANVYYDRKAWCWLMKNIDKLKTPIIFWNIGE